MFFSFLWCFAVSRQIISLLRFSVYALTQFCRRPLQQCAFSLEESSLYLSFSNRKNKAIWYSSAKSRFTRLTWSNVLSSERIRRSDEEFFGREILDSRARLMSSRKCRHYLGPCVRNAIYFYSHSKNTSTFLDRSFTVCQLVWRFLRFNYHSRQTCIRYVSQCSEIDQENSR